jgi:hypothetical protein
MSKVADSHPFEVKLKQTTAAWPTSIAAVLEASGGILLAKCMCRLGSAGLTVSRAAPLRIQQDILMQSELKVSYNTIVWLHKKSIHRITLLSSLDAVL